MNEFIPEDDGITRMEVEASRAHAGSLEAADDMAGTSSTKPIAEQGGDGTPAWMLSAICRDATTDMFFPMDGVGVDRAKKICADCPVNNACLEYALEYRIEHGVWGGTSERQRRNILRRRRLSAPNA